MSSSNAVHYDRWFQSADSDRDGRVTGGDAVAFFGRSGLPREVLATVWELANDRRLGYLDRMAFHKAMDLISLAQSGQPVTKDGYLAQIDAGGFRLPTMAGLSDADGKPIDAAPAAPVGGAIYGSKPVPMKVCTSVIDGLKQIYFTKVRPLEEQFKFGHFFSPLLNESDFEAKPSVLLLGQYSTGKTTFIKYLLGRDYPGTHIGPEPTTDRFVVVSRGAGGAPPPPPAHVWVGLGQHHTPGPPPPRNTPYTHARTRARTRPPGVLSGEKQRIERAYNFVEICEWFAARCDLIFLLFDPYKLDISDEFKSVINCLRGHDDKVRVILNKADQVDQQQLMRVYGALMWSLGKVFRSPEVCKVYVGSFNSDAPINERINPYGKPLFEAEQKQLLADLYEIPQRSTDRKINEFVKRVRAAKIHILLIGHLRKQMPSMFGKEKAQKKLLDDIIANFEEVWGGEKWKGAGVVEDRRRFPFVEGT
ncbi:hypothetical protein VOLCADRAFT_55400 [Volvox carteri f. nagariensis]|uniref:Uncharacterized protein n=1 Tax=Volvox carteri f. nagariensis TaxID=3068 RepID=D8TI11_VOLCA|nr:uncharacterized protein VOLCADRAFT_55400 [Volvox carteri f. nagariensis]EFJ53160.1 hypothetical protein VOLCADRAFT_55400 [Volvox carteri f. nagariensis]|eukprot:XP_002946165.1 hypothetical protein VOLCADRAFT_55400 [Volvox carteri f. nagariensis]